MKITVSAIKADVGGIGGHTRPSDGPLGCSKIHSERGRRYAVGSLHRILWLITQTHSMQVHVLCRCQFLEYATLQCVYHPHSIRCNDPTAYLLPLSLWILLHHDKRPSLGLVCPPIPPTSAFIAETVIFIFCEIISPMIYV